MENTSDSVQQYLDTLHTPKTSCWFRTEQHKIELPMVSLDYKININNNFCMISLRQEYVNPLDKPLEINFSYPIDTNFCLTKLEATFNGYTVGGVIK